MAYERQLKLHHNTIDTNEELEILSPHIQGLEEHVVEQNMNYEAIPLRSLLTHLDYENWFIVCIWNDETLLAIFPLQKIKQLPLPVFQCSTLFKDHPVSCVPLIHQDHATEVIDQFWLWFNEQARILYLAQSLPDSDIGRHWLSGASKRKGFVSLSHTTDRAIADVSEISFDEYMETNLSSRLKRTRKQKLRQLDALGGFKTEITTAFNGSVRSQVDHLISVEGSEWKVIAGSAIASNPKLESFVRDLADYAASKNRIFLITSSVGGTPAGAMFGLVNGKKCYIYKIGYNPEYSKYSIGILTLVSLIEQATLDSSIHILDSCGDSDIEIYNRCFPKRQVINQYQIASNHLFPKCCLLFVIKTRGIRVNSQALIRRTWQRIKKSFD